MAAGEGVQLDREVTIGVPNSPERDEAADAKARLFAKFPAGCGLRPLTGLDLAARELPEARKEAGRRSTLDQPPTTVGQDHDRGTDMRSASAARPPRQRPRVRELTMRAACERDRAGRALRSFRTTDRFPELHDRLVELAGAGPG